MAPPYSYTKTFQVSQICLYWDDSIDVVMFKICQLDALKSNLTVVPQRDQLDRKIQRIHRHRAKFYEEAACGRHLETRASLTGNISSHSLPPAF